MKKTKIILSFATFLLILSSCGTNNINGPNFDKNDKLNDLTKTEQLDIGLAEQEIDSLLQEEINDRKNSYEELNSNKEYLLSIKVELENEINNFNKYNSVIRQLMEVDIKIIDSIIKGVMKEDSINNKNYFYTYLQNINKSERSVFIKNIDDYISLLGNDKEYNSIIYSMLDETKSDLLKQESINFYEYYKLYSENISFNPRQISTIENIIDYMSILKIDNYDLGNKEIEISGIRQTFLSKTELIKLLKDIR